MEQDLYKQLPHLTHRGHKFGIRVRVPDECQEILGKKVITRSLGTGDPKEVPQAHAKALTSVLDEIASARLQLKPSDPAPLSVETAIALVKSHFQPIAFNAIHDAQQIVNAYHLSPERREEDINELKMSTSQELERVKGDGYLDQVQIVDLILIKAEFPTVRRALRFSTASLKKKTVLEPLVNKTGPGYLEMLKACFSAYIEVEERVLAILSGKEYPAEGSFLTITPNVTVSRPYKGHTARYGGEPKGMQSIALDRLLDLYFKAHLSLNEREQLNLNAAFAPLFDLVGKKTDANKLTKQDFRDFLELLQRLPTHIGNSGKWRGINYLKIAEMAEADSRQENLSRTSVNKYMSRIAKVFKWAADEPLIERNHAAGIKMPADLDNDEKRRFPFEADQLTRLFRTPVFTSPKSREPSLYWAVLIALFHGMRCEEILQLKHSDVQLDKKGTVFFDIHRRDGNHVKTRSSIRHVPVYEKLYDFGFQSLLDVAQTNDSGSLFQDLERGNENKFTPAFSKRFSRYLLQHGLKHKGISFHSFRHNFRDECRSCEVSEEYACALGGWVYSKDVQSQYGKGVPMRLKNDALQKLSYEGVDFSSVTIIDWFES